MSQDNNRGGQIHSLFWPKSVSISLNRMQDIQGTASAKKSGAAAQFHMCWLHVRAGKVLLAESKLQ